MDNMENNKISRMSKKSKALFITICIFAAVIIFTLTPIISWYSSRSDAADPVTFKIGNIEGLYKVELVDGNGDTPYLKNRQSEFNAKVTIENIGEFDFAYVIYCRNNPVYYGMVAAGETYVTDSISVKSTNIIKGTQNSSVDVYLPLTVNYCQNNEMAVEAQFGTGSWKKVNQSLQTGNNPY